MQIYFNDNISWNLISAFGKSQITTSLKDTIKDSSRDVLELHFDPNEVTYEDMLNYFKDTDTQTSVIRLIDDKGKEFYHHNYVIAVKLGTEYVGEDSNPHLVMQLAQLNATDLLLRDIAGKQKVYIGTPLEMAIAKKIDNLSEECNNIIETGVDYNGKHFSMTIPDQLNLESLKTTIMGGAEGVPYHADGENCMIYTSAEFLEIYNACAVHKILQTTYFNQLKQYVLSLESVEEVDAVTYGQELTGQYLTNYNIIAESIQNA